MSRPRTYSARDLLERIDARLRATGKSAEGASIEAGLSRDYIRNLRSNKSGAPRADKLLELAESLETSAGYLLKETEDPAAPVHADAETSLPILFEVAAGQWAPVDDLPQEPLGYAKVINRDQYPFGQWLERVRGDSFDKRVPEGSVVHVVDAIEMGYTPRHRDIVIITRSKRPGPFVERTIKQVEVTDDGRILLASQSSNPKWQDPIPLVSEGVDTRIVGKVVGAYIDL